MDDLLGAIGNYLRGEADNGTPLLPERFIRPRLSDLPVGTPLWTTPWQLHVASDRTMWVSPNMTNSGYGGTAQMRITRVSDDQIRAELFAPTYSNTGTMYGDRYMWDEDREPGEKFMERGYLQVTEFIDRQGERP